MTVAAVAAHGLTIGFAASGTPVVCDVDLAVAPGEIVGVVGESGCGKTTLGLSLLGWTRPGLRITAGSVVVDETDLVSCAAAALRAVRGRVVSYVPQDPATALNPALRIGTQMRETLTAHRGALRPGEDVDTRVREVLTEVGLPPERTVRSYPHELSGGQQQRVGIAVAVLCRPRLIVMDEPTTGLDVSTQRQILAMIGSLSREYGCAVVYVSHDLPVVAQIADRVLVMYAGRVVECGPTASVLGAPRHPYAAGLLKAAPSVDQAGVLVGIPGRPPRPGSWPAGCSFADRCDQVRDDCRVRVPELLPVGPVQVRCVHPLTGEPDPPDVALTPGLASRDEMSVLLRVTSLSAGYGNARVLEDVTFDVPAGRTVAIVGESGSGKTTLARCLSGLHGHWSGEVTYAGERLRPRSARRTAQQRESIQYIFQSPYGALNPKKTIAEVLEAPLLQFRRLRRTQRHELLEQVMDDVSLDPALLDRYPFQLSGGERQRVAIGRALVLSPDLIVCDEVTSALDVSVQAAVVEQLRAVQDRRGVSLLFITHNLAVVRSIAHEVLVLNAGRIVEHGSVETVVDQPADPYTVGLLRDVPRLYAGAARHHRELYSQDT